MSNYFDKFDPSSATLCCEGLFHLWLRYRERRRGEFVRGERWGESEREGGSKREKRREGERYREGMRKRARERGKKRAWE